MIDETKLLKWLKEQKEEADVEYKEQESNCQCSGDGEEYAKYGALLCKAVERCDCLEEVIQEIEKSLIEGSGGKPK